MRACMPLSLACTCHRKWCLMRLLFCGLGLDLKAAWRGGVGGEGEVGVLKEVSEFRLNSSLPLGTSAALTGRGRSCPRQPSQHPRTTGVKLKAAAGCWIYSLWANKCELQASTLTFNDPTTARLSRPLDTRTSRVSALPCSTTCAGR